MPVYRLNDDLSFPPPENSAPDGLLAVGGDLQPERLLLAYSLGIFPWYTDKSPILWWSPDPRLILQPQDIKISKSLRKVIRQGTFKITLDQAFDAVIQGCAEARRPDGAGTWIVKEMISAYCHLHEAGFAHSVESWVKGELVGGLYGVSLGKAFFGESMFMKKSNASKVAFVCLVALLKAWHFDFIDCQVTTDHLQRFGAKEISRSDFLTQLRKALQAKTRTGRWFYPQENFDNLVTHVSFL